LDVLTFALCALATVSNLVASAFNVARIPQDPMFYSLLATIQIGLAVWMFWLGRRSWRRLIQERADARAVARMNVRVVRDGREMPARLFHLGVGEDGQDVWVVLEPCVRMGDELRVDVVPPKTTLIGMGTGPL
jgi:hypothetical protein